MSALPQGLSECSQSRCILAKFAVGRGLEIGAGGDCITPETWTLDLPLPYTQVGNERQMLRGDCRSIPFICDNVLDFLSSCHLLEDFFYGELIGMIREWRRILAPSGVLILNCVDQKRFLIHCAATGQSTNANHKETDFSLRNFIDHVLVFTGDWDTLLEEPDIKPYSWYLVARKV